MGDKATFNDFTLKIDPYLAAILGCEEEFQVNEQSYKCKHKLDIYFHTRYMYIYTNICDFSYYGNQLTQLLRIIALNLEDYKQGTLYSEDFYNEHFYDINIANLNKIDIQIRDSYGNLYPLVEGRTLITQLCKKYE